MAPPAPMKRRTKKLILGTFQLRLVLQFVGVAALALGMQFLFLTGRLLSMSSEVTGTEASGEGLPRVLFETALLSGALLLPLIFAVALLTTHRVAGPLYGMERFLREVAAGGPIRVFKTRKGDQVDSLRDALNDALATVVPADAAPTTDRPVEERREAA